MGEMKRKKLNTVDALKAMWPLFAATNPWEAWWLQGIWDTPTARNDPHKGEG